MGQTIGFPANAAKLSRPSRTAGKRRSEKTSEPMTAELKASQKKSAKLNASEQKAAEHKPATPKNLPSTQIETQLDRDICVDSPEEYFCLTTPSTKYDYSIYMDCGNVRAGVYPYNREYRFIERRREDGSVETVFSGPNLLDSRTVIENQYGEVVCSIRANHLGNGLIEVRYLQDGGYVTEHQAPRECDNFSYVKDSKGRITSLTYFDGSKLQFSFGGNSNIAYQFIDKDGVVWRRCPKREIFYNSEGESLGETPVQTVGANESGSYMYSSYGRYTVVHRDGATEERYFPTIRDLLDQNLPVTVAVRAENEKTRAESFAGSLKTQYPNSDISVAVVDPEHKDGAIVDGRHVSRFY